MRIEPLDGTITTSNGTAGTAAVLLPAVKAPGRKTWIAYNNGTSVVYLGGSNVTSANGLPVGTAAFSPSISLGNSLIYGITASGAGTLSIMEIS
jgi:hypothetical protein